MRLHLIYLIFISCITLGWSQAQKDQYNLHNQWDTLLKKHVDSLGNVDYNGIKKNNASLSLYLSDLANTPPKKDWTLNAKKAYYINLYNAATIQLIITNYPTTSIKNIRKPWNRKIVKIGNSKISLSTIEHKILRKMNDSRIHFAINCASFSCPKLKNSAYTSKDLDTQLTNATKTFINDRSKNLVTTQKMELSKIFKWFKKDFTTSTTLIKYINKYSFVKSKTTTIDYLPYNWSLNEQ